MSETRYDRQTLFFGKSGQRLISGCKVAVVGIGGLGTHVVQQLALLGVGQLTLVDAEVLAETNRNRYVGVRHNDVIPGMRKIDLGERIANEINPSIPVAKVFDSLVSEEAFTSVIHSDYVFGCVDRDGSRFILNELCSAYSRPYIDLGTEIIPGASPIYGGRVCVNLDGQGCLVCMDVIDMEEVQSDLSGPQIEDINEVLYGIRTTDLGAGGPSVVSLNGLVSSIGVTEFMVAVTGIRKPNLLTKYYGNSGKVVVSADSPQPDCYYCKSIRGQQERASVKRYLDEGVGVFLR